MPRLSFSRTRVIRESLGRVSWRVITIHVVSFVIDIHTQAPTKGSRQRHHLDVHLKGQMHHHDDLGSKCAYMCHLSNKTTRKSVLLSTPQIWLMKVSKKNGLSLGIEAAIIRSGANEVTASPASDWLRDISGSLWYLSTNQKQGWQSLH